MKFHTVIHAVPVQASLCCISCRAGTMKFQWICWRARTMKFQWISVDYETWNFGQDYEMSINSQGKFHIEIDISQTEPWKFHEMKMATIRVNAKTFKTVWYLDFSSMTHEWWSCWSSLGCWCHLHQRMPMMALLSSKVVSRQRKNIKYWHNNYVCLSYAQAHGYSTCTPRKIVNHICNCMTCF